MSRVDQYLEDADEFLTVIREAYKAGVPYEVAASFLAAYKAGSGGNEAAQFARREWDI